jgi:hypothetical protein
LRLPEIFRPAIIHSAFAFVLVHNHPSGNTNHSEADLQITKRVVASAQILQIHFLGHVIVGQPIAGRLGSSASRKQDFCDARTKKLKPLDIKLNDLDVRRGTGLQ